MSEPKHETEKLGKFDWPDTYEEMIEDCDDYGDDGNRATYPDGNTERY